MKIELDKRKIVLFFFVIAIVLIVIHSVILVIYYIINDPDKFDFVQMFDLDMERNVPTLFSSLLFMVNALLFYLLSRQASIERKHWFGLSMIFVFLSFDESAKIHEQIGDFTERFIDAEGYLYYPWIISYGIFMIVLAVIYWKFFWKMKREIFFAFMGSAAIFVTGAVGFELLGAKESSMHGTDTKLYSLLYTIEESLEMFGLIYLIWILLTLLEHTCICLKERDS